VYDVVIECNQTGRLVSTGVSVDPEKVHALPSEKTVLTRCQACGHAHGWSRWTAILTAARAVA
jgi:hypothetical protein